MAVGGKRPGAGRPKGSRNRSTVEIKKLASQYGPAALEKIVQLMDSEDEKVSLAAAKELLDRAYGRPKQDMSLTHDVGDNLADRILAARKRARAAQKAEETD